MSFAALFEIHLEEKEGGPLNCNLGSLIIATLLLAGCQSSPEVDASLKVYVFDCGRMNFDSVEAFGVSDHETDVRDLIAPCYVVEHNKGRLLWEGGLASSLVDVAGWQEMEGGWRMQLDSTFAQQLSVIDLSVGDFDYVSFSHFHFDHVGIANELEGAKLIIPRAEYDDAFADVVTTPGFEPSLYDRFGGPNTIVIDGEYDVFGDARVRLLPAPGHTAGHQVLFLDLAQTGPVVLSGDLHILRVGQEGKRVPTFSADSAQTAESMDRIEAFLDSTGADLWLGHDVARYDQLLKPPQYNW
ncbi:MAG: N-acyl homoserine lactonase family protein [Rhodothermales bacterium]|nr:N-acyl homoserine lactonase family protein [Rhodothermales bacterium]